jgi:hypothetical protein
MNESGFGYDENNKISGYNGSAFAGGSTTGFVSGLNTLFVPYYPEASDGNVYSATISGDVTVSTGIYNNNGEGISIGRTYSLSSIGEQLGNKLDNNKIEDSNTISIINNHAEVYSIGYRPSEFVTSGIDVYNNFSNNSVDFRIISYESHLYSATFVIESNGFDENRIPDDWIFVNSANGSATFCKYYKDNISDDSIFYLDLEHTITNASAYVVGHKGRVLDALAFKSDLTGITYTTGSI